MLTKKHDDRSSRGFFLATEPGKVVLQDNRVALLRETFAMHGAAPDLLLDPNDVRCTDAEGGGAYFPGSSEAPCFVAAMCITLLVC